MGVDYKAQLIQQQPSSRRAWQKISLLASHPVTHRPAKAVPQRHTAHPLHLYTKLMYSIQLKNLDHKKAELMRMLDVNELSLKVLQMVLVKHVHQLSFLASTQ